MTKRMTIVMGCDRTGLEGKTRTQRVSDTGSGGPSEWVRG